MCEDNRCTYRYLLLDGDNSFHLFELRGKIRPSMDGVLGTTVWGSIVDGRPIIPTYPGDRLCTCVLSSARSPVWEEKRVVGYGMASGSPRHSLNFRTAPWIDRRYDLHRRSYIKPGDRLSGNRTSSPVVVCRSLLLGKSPGEEVAGLGFGSSLCYRDSSHGTWPVDGLI